MNDAILIDRKDAIFEICINRPQANAIDAATSRLMSEVFLEFENDDRYRVAILTGNGDRFFSAGWDLKAAAAGEDYEADYGAGGFGGISEFFSRSKPVIAAVNGMAVGGGFELALATDIIIASENASFFFAEVFVGVLPDSGCLRLPKQLPYHLAMEMLMTGRKMTAAEAYQFGLINHVVTSESLMEKARSIAMTLVNAAPLALQAIKEIVRHTADISIEEGYELLHSDKLRRYRRMLDSEDAREGPLAFTEKRKPQWKGR